MIGFVIKNWRLFVDILIVIALVLGFTFWDPFGFFRNSKLIQTANMVSQVRDIGQLVTAEYFGEVLSSWKDLKVNSYPEDSVTQSGLDLYFELKSNLMAPENQREKKSGDFRLSPDKQREYSLVYHEFMAFLGTRYLTRRLERIYDEKTSRVKANAESKVIRELFVEFDNYNDRLEKKFKNKAEYEEERRDYLDSIPPFVNDFFAFYSMLKATNEDRNDKKNIVFIGRGWVKAGFDFGSFDNSNFLFDKATKTVHFFDLKPVVLDTDINPWFIPQSKVKGFELISFSKKLSFEDAKEVKAECKRKLLDQARRADIIKHAQVNGEEALRNFFSLLMNEPELKIMLHLLPYDRQLAMIASDTLISLSEAILIDSLYRREQSKIDSLPEGDQKQKSIQHLTLFTAKLKKLPFLKTKYPFNYYTMKAAVMLKDTFHLSQTDYDSLLLLRGRLEPLDSLEMAITTDAVRKNSYWFDKSDFMREYNASLEVLSNESLDSVEVKEDTDKKVKDSLAAISPRKQKILAYAYDSRLQFQFLTSNKADTAKLASILKSQKRPTTHNPELDALQRIDSAVFCRVVRNLQVRDDRVSPLQKIRAEILKALESLNLKTSTP